jgi:hypothetical protein
LKSLWAILKGYGKVDRECPNTSRQPIGKEAELPSGYQQKRGNFCSFTLKRCISVFINKKLKDTLKNFTNSQRLLSYLFSL